MVGKSVKNDMRFSAETHRRWLGDRNRKQEEGSYRAEWWQAQCGACRYWVALSGALGNDCGACSNAASAFDGRVRFEHDGCEQFEKSIDGWGQSDDGR